MECEYTFGVGSFVRTKLYVKVKANDCTVNREWLFIFSNLTNEAISITLNQFDNRVASPENNLVLFRLVSSGEFYSMSVNKIREFLLRIWGINITDWAVTLCEGPQLLWWNISDNLLCREYWKLMAHSAWPLFRTYSSRNKVLQFLRIGVQLNVLKRTKCWMLLPQECKLELAHYPNCQHVGRGQPENK